jgi:hypothetical protein
VAPMLSTRVFSNLGVRIFGLATALAGVLDFIWGEFEPAHQPIQAWGDHIPGQQIMAYLTAVWLTAAGTALLWRRSARAGATASGIIYFIFAMFWPPRLYTAPVVLGYHIRVYIGVLAGMASQIILVAAAAIVYVSISMPDSVWRRRVDRIARWTFGLCSVNFGLAHLTDVPNVAPMVPRWMPLGQEFWTILTGVFFTLAGLAILSGILDVLGARLLSLMLLVFSALALAPNVFASPHRHVPWGANAYNLAAVGAVWILADSIANNRAQQERNIMMSQAQVSTISSN